MMAPGLAAASESPSRSRPPVVAMIAPGFAFDASCLIVTSAFRSSTASMMRSASRKPDHVCGKSDAGSLEENRDCVGTLSRAGDRDGCQEKIPQNGTLLCPRETDGFALAHGCTREA